MKSSKILLKDGQTVDLVDGRIADGDIASWNNKLNKVSGATEGDVATLDANGNLVDSGVNFNPSTNTMSVNISGKASRADSASDTTSGSIQANDDLNSYNASNRNYICNAANASTVTNKPSGASGAFELEVIRGTGDTCVQVYYSRDNVNFNYIRKRTGINNGTWTGWVKIIDSDDTVANTVCVNIAQDFNDEQKKRGRVNIGATRVVFINTTATNAQIRKIVAAGDTPVLRVSDKARLTFFNLEKIYDLYAEFFAIIGNNVVTYTCSYDTWTRTEKPYRNEWVSFTPDTLQTTAAKKIFAIGEIEFGYYFDSNASFRLAMRSTSGTRTVFLSDHRGFGGEYSVTTDWNFITFNGFSNSNQLEHFKGYDTTGNVNLDFDVYFVIVGVSTVVAQYRINL